MSKRDTDPLQMPPSAGPALAIAGALREAGFVALLAGGCVRDVLRGAEPKDFDVATNATPMEIMRLFPKTREVGAAFGVVLVRKRGVWVEVATFREDGAYEDGRRPSEVRFTTAENDARRRDFTINGMFFDPVDARVIDYVGGVADLRAGLIRAIGEAAARFAEDYLRLIRAVRFAARLGFAIEPATEAAIRDTAANLARVAAERRREELEKMFVAPTRSRAFEMLRELGLLEHMWPGAQWADLEAASAAERLWDLPAEPIPFAAALAALLADRTAAQVQDVCRSLTCSNEQRALAAWLVAHQADLDEPAELELAALKRLMAHDGFASLRWFAAHRYASVLSDPARDAALAARIAAIEPAQIAPEPFVRGEDLHARGVAQGPRFGRMLDELYTAQLNERVRTRDEALQWLDARLAEGTSDA